MRLLPPVVPFLGTSRTDTPTAILLGAPLDVTESFQSGTAAAPDRIRKVSDVLETYSPALDRDLLDVCLADWGNVDLTNQDVEADLQMIGEAMTTAADRGLPILLGGEHTVTVGAVRSLARRYHDLSVVQLDAHTDLRETYDGKALSHATVMRRIADVVGLDHIAQLGIRSGTREEFALARACLSSSHDLQLTAGARNFVLSHPVYLTIDIDVLDAASAPGTGCPEPGGASFNDVLQHVYSLRGANVVAVDVTEVLPAVDVNDITSIAAAKLVRETALLFGDHPRLPRANGL
jgi:agmatinase